MKPLSAHPLVIGGAARDAMIENILWNEPLLWYLERDPEAGAYALAWLQFWMEYGHIPTPVQFRQHMRLLWGLQYEKDRSAPFTLYGVPTVASMRAEHTQHKIEEFSVFTTVHTGRKRLTYC